MSEETDRAEETDRREETDINEVYVLFVSVCVLLQVMPQHRDADIVLENVSPMLEVLFEELFFVAILLLIW